MGFHRKPMVAALDRAGIAAEATRMFAEELAFASRPHDPFGVDDPCPLNSSGHQFTGSCGDVVCVHCAKIVWS